jgi:hypothetical protein
MESKSDLFDKVLDVGWVAQVCGDKASLTTSSLDLLDDRCAASAVASSNDDLHAIAGEPQGDFFAEAGRRSGHECGQGLVVDGESGHGAALYGLACHPDFD